MSNKKSSIDLFTTKIITYFNKNHKRRKKKFCLQYFDKHHRKIQKSANFVTNLKINATLEKTKGKNSYTIIHVGGARPSYGEQIQLKNGDNAGLRF